MTKADIVNEISKNTGIEIHVILNYLKILITDSLLTVLMSVVLPL